MYCSLSSKPPPLQSPCSCLKWDNPWDPWTGTLLHRGSMEVPDAIVSSLRLDPEESVRPLKPYSPTDVPDVSPRWLDGDSTDTRTL